MKENAINLTKVTKKFGNVTAVNNVSLKIPKGKFLDRRECVFPLLTRRC